MNQERREAFFGLIAPIGVDLEAVISAITEALKIVNYNANPIKLTNILNENPKWYDLEYKTELERYEKYIAAGDQLCQDSGRQDILAHYGIASLGRYSPRGKDDPLPNSIVHIFRQIKRVDEIRAFEEIFGRNILFIACYSPKKDRVNYLVTKMLQNERGTSKTKLEGRALDIISTDEDERDKPTGQRVSECYPHADFVLDCTSHESLKRSSERFVNIYFGSPFISPTVDEYSSYIANAASYRSLDLSRQVGAAIVGSSCEIISMGCNEVPKAGGGTYWVGGDKDFRDYALGYDSNQKLREDMTRDILVRLQDSEWLSDRFKDLKPDELVSESFARTESAMGPLSRSMLSDVIEYGRMVHAEMNALADAARFRRSTIGATLYCTTLPCHMCTKLIIASGITRVVFVQPYTKSLVEELFFDSISVDDHPEGVRVVFDSLKGVTPNGFKRAFHKAKKRKDDHGRARRWNPTAAEPSFLTDVPYYQTLERVAFDRLKSAIERVTAIRGSEGQRLPKV